MILLKEGTDTSQGKAQLLSNITAALAVVDILRTTLGPSGSDKLIVDAKGCHIINVNFLGMEFPPSFVGKAVISNDGATIMKLLDVVHPAARSLVDIARAQDAEVDINLIECRLVTALPQLFFLRASYWRRLGYW